VMKVRGRASTRLSVSESEYPKSSTFTIDKAVVVHLP
jgi:hypothetical protein